MTGVTIPQRRLTDGARRVGDRAAVSARRLSKVEVSADARWLWLCVLVFVSVSFWWLTQDDRIPIWDAGAHMNFAFKDSLALSDGHVTEPFTIYTTYPPLVHLLGALTILLVGMHPMALVMTSNLVFVPLLAFGCYGVGKLVAGTRAGLLAGIFGLCAPMVVSMMHEFYIDTPQAAMVAVSLWAMLASRRFEALGVSILAGALCGLALLTKETSVVFLAGAGVAMVLRGGWRHPAGLVGFGAALAVVAAPWYVDHWHDMSLTFTQIGQLYVNPLQSPPRWSAVNLDWYFWNLVNQQVLLPLTLAFVVGVVIAIWRCLVDRFSSSSLLPEVLSGVVVSYLAMTYLTHKDPRYTLPFLVYIAVLGTFWIPQIAKPRIRAVVTAAVIFVAGVNFIGMSTGIGGPRRVMLHLPNAQPTTFVWPGNLTLFENGGWLRGGPLQDGDARALLVGLRRMGIRTVSLDPGENVVDFSMLGYQPLADQLHMTVAPGPSTDPRSAYLFLHSPRPGDPRPCQMTGTGGIYAVRGNPTGLNVQLLKDPSAQGKRYDFICPGGASFEWPRTHS